MERSADVVEPLMYRQSTSLCLLRIIWEAPMFKELL